MDGWGTNQHARRIAQVGQSSDRFREERQIWFGHVNGQVWGIWAGGGGGRVLWMGLAGRQMRGRLWKR